MFDHKSQRIYKLIAKYVTMLCFVFVVSYSIQNTCYTVLETSVIIAGFSAFMFVILDKLFPEIVFIENQQNHLNS